MKPSTIKAIRDFAELDDNTLGLIRLANHDLYCGPLSVDDAEALIHPDVVRWPGFVEACRLIRDAIDASPASGDLWIDGQSGIVQDREPEWTQRCENCSECEEGEYECGECLGEGFVTNEHPEDWTHIDARDVKRVLVGKDLAEYV